MKRLFKKNDEVVVIAGKQKGSRGKVLNINYDTDRVTVEGVRMIKKHIKKTNQAPGEIVEKEGTIHISNVMESTRFDAKRAKKGK